MPVGSEGCYLWCMPPSVRAALLLLVLAAACTSLPDPAEPPTPGPLPDPTGCLLLAGADDDLALVDVALDAGIQDRFGVNTGMSAEDFDGDGDIDVYLANAYRPAQLMMSEGDGTFVPHPAPPSAGADLASSAPDFDNDGDPDLYVVCGGWSGGCVNRLFRNEGLDEAGWLRFTDVTQSAGLGSYSLPTFGGSWADYDGDGDVDLFQPVKQLQGDPYPSRDLLFRNEGDGTFVEVGADAGVDGEGDGHPSTWLDYDEDGWPDLFVAVHVGPNRLYRNRGDGTFVEETPPMMDEPYLAFASLTADVNQDGHADLLVNGRSILEPGGNTFAQDHGLFLGDGAGGWTDASHTTGLNDPGDSATHIETMGFQAADIDNDGFPEVLFGNGGLVAGAVNALGSFVPTEDGGIRWVDRTPLIDVPSEVDGKSPPAEEYPYRTHGMAFFDYDGDGDRDLLLGNGGGDFAEPNRLFRNDSAPRNHFVRVTLRGDDAPADGTGARVRVSNGPPGDSHWAVYGAAWPVSGFNSSQPRQLLIGTGRCEGPYHVEVTWPDGDVQSIEGVEAGAALVVDEAG